MAFSVSKNSYSEQVITCWKEESQCRMQIWVGDRCAEGIPVTFVSHFKMNPTRSSYFGYAVGYETAYVDRNGNYHVLSSATPAGYQRDSWGNVVSGYGLGDPPGLMKRYGGGCNPGGYYGDNGTYWRPKYGWLPEDSGPRAGTSTLFSGVIPMDADQSDVTFRYRTRRPWLTTNQWGYEDYIPYGDEWNSDAWFNIGVQEFTIHAGMWKVIPKAPTSIITSPSSIDLADANTVPIRLSFKKGVDAIKTRIWLLTDMDGFSIPTDGVLVKDTDADSFEEDIDVWSFLGTDSYDGQRHIAKHIDNVGKHVWFRLESVSKTGHSATDVPETTKTEYYETPSVPPVYFKTSPSKLFFMGDTAEVEYPASTQGTFSIVSLEVSLPGIGDVPVQFDPDGGRFNADFPELGLSGWSHAIGMKLIDASLSAYDEAGREVYSTHSVSRPHCQIYGVGMCVYSKVSSSWVMGLAYVKTDDGWVPARRGYKKTSGGWQ